MFSHVTIGIDDFAAAEPFYDAIMAVLGHDELIRYDRGKGYGAPSGAKLFIGPAYNGHPATAGNGTHVAFVAADRPTVDAFHAAALAHGGSDEGGPGLRPHYHPDYYGAYVRDPEGNKLQAVCHARAD
ncbi:MAG: VOC family protein [Sphingopyxis sp.]|uniref:VOC family protein n=1 Tax=Sphingopyxis sp. TaxID=1908224 RepID=UPI003D6D771E